MNKTPSEILRCYRCGYEAKKHKNNWTIVNNPTLGNIKQCPECKSTNIREK